MLWFMYLCNFYEKHTEYQNTKKTHHLKNQPQLRNTLNTLQKPIMRVKKNIHHCDTALVSTLKQSV